MRDPLLARLAASLRTSLYPHARDVGAGRRSERALRPVAPASASFGSACALVVLMSAAASFGQGPVLVGPTNGPMRAPAPKVALVGATVHLAEGTEIPNATVVFAAGRIESVAEGARPPEGARVVSLAGKHLWPGWIEPSLEVDAPALDPKRTGAYPIAGVSPDRSVLQGAPDVSAKRLRDLGFTAAAIYPRDGHVRGYGAVVSLADPSGALPRAVYSLEGAQFIDDGRQGGFPSSEMGWIALVRQVFADAAWVRQGEETSILRALPEIGGTGEQIHYLFDADDELQVLRMAALAAEAGLEGAAIRGSGRELRRLEAVVAALQAGDHPLILPLEFPSAPAFVQADDLEAVELSTLQFYEQAPTNPRRLHEAGLRIALTTAGRRGVDGQFGKHLRAAIAAGLAEADVLRMLTTVPAAMYGLEDELGEIRAGLRAHVLVTDGPLFAEATKLLAVWIDGEEHPVAEAPVARPKGSYELRLGQEEPIALTIAADGSLRLKVGEEELRAKDVRIDQDTVHFTVEFQAPKGRQFVSLLRGMDDAAPMQGTARGIDGAVGVALLSFVSDALPPAKAAEPKKDVGAETAPKAAEVAEAAPAEEAGAAQAEPKVEAGAGAAPGAAEVVAEEVVVQATATATVRLKPELPALPGLPFGPYAFERYPSQDALVIRQANVWTSGPLGRIASGAVVIQGGKILWVGPDQEVDAWLAAHPLPEGHQVLDAGGKHLTPGLIDAHSHTGISGGVNEGGQAVTAEVRIQDVTDPDDISWYRQLAGGVTTVNAMHGSANPIGGQTQTVKVRWGVAHPWDMHFEGAKPGIKFALGENVKRAGEGRGQAESRYPATRMGVKVLIEDRFLAAQRYMRERGQAAAAARTDYELEAIAEILRGERWIHCHSYRQDEILMLCELAKRYGIRIGTFQHVLEGYKVAPEIAEVAVGASAFSDWWAYKLEVQDAIPWAGAIMHEAGVVVSFNSDSDELARRMNIEAAKAVRYGGLAPEMALRFVTLNPAIQLGIDAYVGSIEVGKHADLALWSHDPLSTRSRCLQTWVDGRTLYSEAMDRAHRAKIAAERARLIEKVLAAKGKDGDSKGRGERGDREQWSADQELRAGGYRALLRAAAREHALDLLRRGFDPRFGQCGECDRVNH